MIIFKEKKVMDCWLAAAAPWIASAVGSIAGGIIGSSSASSRQNSDQAFTAEQNRIAREEQAKQQASDRALQKQFAKHGVSWKATDARAAGLDPIAAMGSQTTYSPVAMPVSAGQSYSSGGNDYSWMGRAGQNIGTAIQRFMTKDQVTTQMELNQLAVERANLENDKLMQENAARSIALNYPTQVAVPAPSMHSQQIEGQGDSVTVQPDVVTRHQDGHKAGIHAMKQYRLGAPDDKGRIPIYSAIEQEAGDAMDADLPTKARYNAREWSKVVKSWAGWKPKKKPKVYKKGYHLRWSRGYGQWMLVPNSTRVKQTRIYGGSRGPETPTPSYKRYKIN